MDGGGGSFKVTMCIINNDERAKRVHLLKESGVKNLFIIGLSTDSKDDIDRVKSLWDFINANTVLSRYNTTIQSDLKLINIIIGLMSNSSRCPCPYCDTDDLNKCSNRMRVIQMMNLI